MGLICHREGKHYTDLGGALSETCADCGEPIADSGHDCKAGGSSAAAVTEERTFSASWWVTVARDREAAWEACQEELGSMMRQWGEEVAAAQAEKDFDGAFAINRRWEGMATRKREECRRLHFEWIQAGYWAQGHDPGRVRRP